jgi:hypothetical protein
MVALDLPSVNPIEMMAMIKRIDCGQSACGLTKQWDEQGRIGPQTSFYSDGL